MELKNSKLYVIYFVAYHHSNAPKVASCLEAFAIYQLGDELEGQESRHHAVVWR